MSQSVFLCIEEFAPACPAPFGALACPRKGLRGPCVCIVSSFDCKSFNLYISR